MDCRELRTVAARRRCLGSGAHGQANRSFAHECPAEATRIAIFSSAFFESGGPEALLQLALAIGRACAVYLIETSLAPRFRTEYPEAARLPQLAWAELRPGDVVVVPEVKQCARLGLVSRGVRVLVWLLASHAPLLRWTDGGHVFSAPRNDPPGARLAPAELQEQGCAVLSHSHWLSRHGLPSGAAPLPVVRPYVTASTRAFCSGNGHVGGGLAGAFKRELVLVDDDTPPQIVREVQRACHGLRCEVSVVRGKSATEVRQLLSRAKVVVDWCMVGVERLPLEAVLCGAILITSASCEGGHHPLDFPIPRRYVLRSGAELRASLARALRSFESEASAFAPMRRLYGRETNGSSMASEAAAMLDALWPRRRRGERCSCAPPHHHRRSDGRQLSFFSRFREPREVHSPPGETQLASQGVQPRLRTQPPLQSPLETQPPRQPPRLLAARFDGAGGAVLRPPGFGSESLFRLAPSPLSPLEEATRVHHQLLLRVNGTSGATPLSRVHLKVELVIRGALWRSYTTALCLAIELDPRTERRLCNRRAGPFDAATWVFVPGM